VIRKRVEEPAQEEKIFGHPSPSGSGEDIYTQASTNGPNVHWRGKTLLHRSHLETIYMISFSNRYRGQLMLECGV